MILTCHRNGCDYWQKKPVLIKAGIKHFSDPLDADELAGLAAENQIESRLIYQRDGQWQAEIGPFDDYQRFGEHNWSLVVQSVNHWSPKAQALARCFDFIPQWRLDDVMVSFAAPGGGVGPHVDNYDVFICQGSGQRRWKVGEKDSAETVVAHEKLLHVKAFEPVIDEVVSAGDVLYIPPGFPHEGVSIDASMSFSVGYKAVNATELLSGFADYLIDCDDKPVLLSDRERKISNYGQISAADSHLLHAFLTDAVDDSAKFNDFLGRYLSQSRCELDLASEDYAFEDWLQHFQTTPLRRLYALKVLYVDETVGEGIFYLDGERQQLPAEAGDAIQRLCNSDVVDYSMMDNPAVLKWLWEASKQGYWYFDE